jgi:transporter family-2 protein
MSHFLGFIVVMLAAVGAGMSSMVQQAVNAALRANIGSAAWAGVVSYIVGTFCVLIIALASRDDVPTVNAISRDNWWAWTGGFFGAIFIGVSIVLIPRLGAATYIALMITGQMIASLIIDHFAFFGVTRHATDFPRLVGAFLLVSGVVLIRL